MLKDWLDGYLTFTQFTEPKELYRKWVGISTLASCLERKVFGKWVHTPTYANMYIVLVGPPGRPRKTTAIRQGLEFLQEMDINLAADVITKEALRRRLANCTRMMTTVGTETSSVGLHASMTIHAEELTVFLGYKNLDLMTDLGAWYDCKDTWTYETKNKGVDDVKGVWVNLLGATTPELLQTAIPKELIGGGFASRLLMIYEDDLNKPIPYHKLTAEEIVLQEMLIQDLRDVSILKGEFTLSPEYITDYSAWYGMQMAQPIFMDSRLQAYESRRPTHIRKLSMIANVNHTNNMVLRTRDLLTAVEWLEEAEINLPRIYQDIGAQPLYELEKQMGTWIARQIQTRGPFRVSELVQQFQSHVSNEDMSHLLMRFDMMDFCKAVKTAKNAPAIIQPGKMLLQQLESRVDVSNNGQMKKG